MFIQEENTTFPEILYETDFSEHPSFLYCTYNTNIHKFMLVAQLRLQFKMGTV